MISQRDSSSGKTPSEIGTKFESFIGQTARPIFWQISFMALTSSISILEVVAHLVEDFNFSRKIATIAITAVFLHGLKKSSSPVTAACGIFKKQVILNLVILLMNPIGELGSPPRLLKHLSNLQKTI